MKPSKPLPTTAPAAAMEFDAGICLFAADTGSEASNGAPIKPVEILARSGEPVDHWYWGRIIHDLAGAEHDDRIPLEDGYHGEEIGYADQFRIDEDGLHVGGEVIAFKADDYAARVIHMAAHGTPYQGSINFNSGTPPVLEDVPAGFETEVNGKTFAGPLTVARKWRLRAVAITKLGQDHRTAAHFAAAQTETIPITYLENSTMTQEATKTPTNEPDPADVVINDEVETPADVTPAPTPAPAEAQQHSIIPDAQRYTNAFGEQQGAVWFVQGKPFDECVALFAAQNRADDARRQTHVDDQLKQMSDQIAALKATGGNGADPADNQPQGKGQNNPAAFNELIEETQKQRKPSGAPSLQPQE